MEHLFTLPDNQILTERIHRLGIRYLLIIDRHAALLHKSVRLGNGRAELCIIVFR